MTYRTMLESLIYLKFMTKEDKDDIYREFIKYGIGQKKLFKAHLAGLIDEKKIESTQDLVDYVNLSTDDEIWDELVAIKLANFDNIRKLADATDLKYEYPLYYQPYSITEHGQWPALKRFYLKRCKNPLHRLHFIGNARLPSLDLTFLMSTTNLFYEAYAVWIKVYGLEDEVKPILEEYAKCIQEIKKPKQSK